MRPTIQILAASLVIGVAVNTRAASYYVAQDGQTPASPYTSWATAASNIQEAVDEAPNDATVWVGPGRYTLPPSPTDHLGINVVYVGSKMLTLRSSSGDPADTIIDGEGKYRGVTIYHPTAASSDLFVFDGLTIENGLSTNRGGGILIGDDRAWTCVMRNCVIASNTVASTNWPTGGGLYRTSTSHAWSLLMSNCVVRGNLATNTLDVDRSGGGGWYVRSTGLKKMVNCTVEDNWAGKAGGIWPHQGSLEAYNTTFRGNMAPRSENATWGGGGVFTSGTQVDLRGCLFDRNISGNSGGAVGIQMQHGASYSVQVHNCTFVSNRNDAFYIRNWSVGQGYFPALQLWNSVFTNNWPEDVDLPPASVDAPITNSFTNCCFASTNFDFKLVGDGNIAANPKFVDLDGWNYRLKLGSPCINTGVIEDWMSGATDLDGDPRIDRASGRADIGCYEYQFPGAVFIVR